VFIVVFHLQQLWIELLWY